jgi:thioredoxin reductase (NADPH)
VDWRRLEAKGEDRLLGRGIFYGAARHEATNVVGKKVFIVGGGKFSRTSCHVFVELCG